MEWRELGCLWIQGELKGVLGSERTMNIYRGRWRRPAVGAIKLVLYLPSSTAPSGFTIR